MFSRLKCYLTEFQSIILLFDGFNRPYCKILLGGDLRRTLWHLQKIGAIKPGFLVIILITAKTQATGIRHYLNPFEPF